MFARRFQIPNLLESGATFFCGNQYAIYMGRPEQRTRKREAAGKTCRKTDLRYSSFVGIPYSLGYIYVPDLLIS